MVRDVGGPVQINMGAGTVRVAGANDAVQAKIGAGTLIVEGQPREDWFLVSGVGRVEVRLPKGRSTVFPELARTTRTKGVVW